MLSSTLDPDVFIEEQRLDYIRYRSLSDGRRWSVRGHCIYEGDGFGPCTEGAVGPPPGPPEGRLDFPTTLDQTCSLCIDGGHLTVQALQSAPLRIIIPALQEQCPAAQALRIENLHPEIWNVRDDPYAYGRLLRETWNRGRGFVLVEHDVVPWPGAIERLVRCYEPWCGYGYCVGRAQIGYALGCLSFSQTLVRETPGLLDLCDSVPWQMLDGFVMSLMRRAGYEEFHVHEPAVGHAPLYAED